MGRKAKFTEEKTKKGPGRKAKKQKDPKFPKAALDEPEKKPSHRQKQRALKRIQKRAARKEKIKEIKKIKKENVVTKELSQNVKSTTIKQVSIPNGSTSKPLKRPKNFVHYPQESDEEEEPKVDMKGFSDHNKQWLKPKQVKTAMFDSEEDDSDEEDEDQESEEDAKVTSLNDLSDEDDDEFDSDSIKDEDESDSDSIKLEEDEEDDLLPIEKETKKLRAKQKREQKLADEELKLNIAGQEVFQFPNDVENEQMTLQDIQQRVRDVIVVLADFNKLRDGEHSRGDYMELLQKDLCNYYSYNLFLMEKFMELFSLSELVEFLEASEVERPLTIRTNTLKIRRRDLAQALINRGVNLDPVGQWSKVGLVVYSSQVPMGATPEYLAGQYIIQGASSFLPVMALAPQENERILDMCSAPGGKASHIAAIMKNTGVLVANDVNKNRITAVVGNFHRMGVINSIISTLDGRKFTQTTTGFDRVLLDAPCTGTGVIAKDPSVKTNKDQQDIQRCSTLQRELLLAAIDSVNSKSSTGGYIVYSTCSVLVEENEAVIDYALKRRNVCLVQTGLEFGTEGFTTYRQHRFHPNMKFTRRFYPHTHNMDGFFVAKLKKFSNVIPKPPTVEEAVEEVQEVSIEDIEEKMNVSPSKGKKRKHGGDVTEKSKKSKVMKVDQLGTKKEGIKKVIKKDGGDAKSKKVKLKKADQSKTNDLKKPPTSTKLSKEAKTDLKHPKKQANKSPSKTKVEEVQAEKKVKAVKSKEGKLKMKNRNKLGMKGQVSTVKSKINSNKLTSKKMFTS
uniref:SAM-dependent MTase RsmB/NOP-type domain-containing protein n=1 Tax=Photinus pyralis TaxID=7054 RepID=A0A1Y1N3Y3_PHOPY